MLKKIFAKLRDKLAGPRAAKPAPSGGKPESQAKSTPHPSVRKSEPRPERPAGAGAAVAYVRGDLDANLSANLERSSKAVNRAVETLQFAKVSENKDALQAIFVARNAADKKIEIRLETAGDSLTKIKIRVGVFGDEALSLAILDKVKAAL